jgi:hypothetical protein
MQSTKTRVTFSCVPPLFVYAENILKQFTTGYHPPYFPKCFTIIANGASNSMKKIHQERYNLLGMTKYPVNTITARLLCQLKR